MTHGEFCWHEIMTPDADGAKRFYSELFGWEHRDTDMGGFTYTMFSKNGQDLAGLMAMTGPEWQGVPPHWMLYVNVDDIQESIKKLEAIGGKVCVPPTEIPIGTFSVVSDPAGTTFSLFQAKQA